MALRNIEDALPEREQQPAPAPQPTAQPAAPPPQPAPTGQALVPAGAPAAGALAVVDDSVREALQVLHEEGVTNLLDVNDAGDHLGSAMALLKIQQRDDKEAGLVGGSFTHAVTGEQFAAPVVSLLIVSFGRQWAEKFDPRDPTLKVICSSHDGRAADLPQADSHDPQRHPGDGTLCATCPKAKWGQNRTPPECSELYRCLCWVHEDAVDGKKVDEPVVVLVRKTGIRSLRTWRQRVMALGARACRAAGVAPGVAGAFIQCQLATQHVTKGGDYYVLETGKFEECAPERARGLLQALGTLAPAFAKLRAEEVKGAEADDPFEGGGASGAGSPAPAARPAGGSGGSGGFSGASQDGDPGPVDDF